MGKLDAKLRDRERAAKRLGSRLAAMTAAERAAHATWQKTHQPGPTGRRAADREKGRQDREARHLLIETDRTADSASNPESAALAEAIAELQRKAERLQADHNAERPDEGVFG